MSKAREGYKNLQELKFQEMVEFRNQHKDVITTWLQLQREYNELSSKGTNALMNEVDRFMKSVKNK